MGSVGIYVHSADITRDVVEKYLAENTRSGNDVLYSSWRATGTGRWGDRWSYVLYQAVREVSTGAVTAWVTLAGRGDHQVFTKCLTEQCGPGQSIGVPKRLLAMLTDTASEYTRQCAHRWHTTRGKRCAPTVRTSGSRSLCGIRSGRPPIPCWSLTRLRSTLNGRLCRAPRDWWLGKWEP